MRAEDPHHLMMRENFLVDVLDAFLDYLKETPTPWARVLDEDLTFSTAPHGGDNLVVTLSFGQGHRATVTPVVVSMGFKRLRVGRWMGTPWAEAMLKAQRDVDIEQLSERDANVLVQLGLFGVIWYGDDPLRH